MSQKTTKIQPNYSNGIQPNDSNGIQPNDSNGKEKHICKKTRDRIKSFL
jgi:hypothetical protein